MGVENRSEGHPMFRILVRLFAAAIGVDLPHELYHFLS